MSQANYVQIPQKWTLLDDLIPDFSNNVTYVLTHRSDSTIMFLENDSLPDNNTKAGTPFYPEDRQAFYKKGKQNIYTKANNNNTFINITEGD